MASAITHALVGTAIGLLAQAVARPAPRPRTGELLVDLDAESERRLLKRLPWYAAALALLPDADVLMHAFVRYSHPFGHRGAFHSLAFCLLCAGLLRLVTKPRAMKRLAFFCYLGALTSHPLLDMLTNGGLGIALLFPLTTERLFFPWRPIPVSPLGVAGFFGARGLRILSVELSFAVPLLLGAWWLRRVRSRQSSTR